jgi:hypothetical protein
MVVIFLKVANGAQHHTQSQLATSHKLNIVLVNRTSQIPAKFTIINLQVYNFQVMNDFFL